MDNFIRSHGSFCLLRRRLGRNSRRQIMWSPSTQSRKKVFLARSVIDQLINERQRSIDAGNKSQLMKESLIDESLEDSIMILDQILRIVCEPEICSCLIRGAKLQGHKKSGKPCRRKIAKRYVWSGPEAKKSLPNAGLISNGIRCFWANYLDGSLST